MKALSVLIALFACAFATSAVRDLNTPRVFPEIENRREWNEHAERIRHQALVSCGLSPMPKKTPLRARVFDRIDNRDYTVEKVYFESLPGVYVAGNLYRPVGRGPFPAILNPHGHWENGRMADAESGSVAARCINFAKQGMIAFSYDMVGYNDTFLVGGPEVGPGRSSFYQRHRTFATNDADLLWNINLMGLQTWNSIRALDFLESLRDVDPKRLACTGASGGGTQTFMLGAIDDRLAALAPVVMVSHSMQGGCSCENAPGLRVEYSNMEIAAAAAPRPQLIVGATGDWTKTLLSVEGPAVASIYRLFNRGEQLEYKIFNFQHNYNQASREAVYEFFAQHLDPPSPSSTELAYRKEPDAALRVFPDEQLPPGARTEPEVKQYMREAAERKWRALVPTGKGTLKDYKAAFMPAWEQTMQLHGAEPPQLGFVHVPCGEKTRATLILAHPDGTNAFLTSNGEPADCVQMARKLKLDLIVMKSPPARDTSIDQTDLFYTTYNRTYAQERVRELVNACRIARVSGGKAFLVGEGTAGLWALMAAPAADGVIANCAEVNVSDDSSLLDANLFVPGIRRLHAFEGIALLAAPNPLLLHGTGSAFPVATVSDVYKRLKAEKKFRQAEGSLGSEEIAGWLSNILED